MADEKLDVTAERDLVAGILAKMTLSEKVGQLLMVGFPGPEPPETLLDLLRSGCAGGVILFAGNVAGPDQVVKLTGMLQEAAGQSRDELPLLIAIDQEGGAVVRFTRGGTVFPGNMALGATDREDLAYRSGKAMAEELAALGINMNLAPVLDVNNNCENPIIGIRSFGADPEAVARLGTAAAQGLQDGGVLAVGKHFPGHGDTTVDSHLNLPVITHPVSRLNEVELVPFRAAIRNGIAGIMTAHIVFPALEDAAGRPATLSKPILTDLLRHKMGFTGLIMTDCLEMDAIAANYEIGEAVTRAVLAGADQLLISHTYAKQRAAHQGLLSRIADGTIPVALIDAAVTRILTAKLAIKNKALVKKTVTFPEQPGAEWATHGALAREIAATSLTLIRNRQKLLPVRLQPDDDLLVLQFAKQTTAVEGDQDLNAGLAEAIAGRHSRLSQLILADGDSFDMRLQLQRELKAKRPALIIATTQDVRRYPAQAETIKWLAAGGYPLVVVALRTPYDLLAFPKVATYVAAYGFRRVTLEAMVRLLWGDILPQGKLPVDIPGLYPLGFGMANFESEDDL